MTAREWKPGDVAHYDGSCDGRMMRTMDGWRDTEGDHRRAPADAFLRPLVVIDPEDEAQVERLLRGYCGWGNRDNADGIENYPQYVAEMQAALREFANPTPPKPEEPTGLGAVVEEVSGKQWVRTCAEPCSANGPACKPWTAVGESGEQRYDAYSDIAAVRVLGSGVES